ncbi:MAG: hypothetical protein AAF423_04875 [Pseudomonadota bacterium]
MGVILRFPSEKVQGKSDIRLNAKESAKIYIFEGVRYLNENGPEPPSASGSSAVPTS